MTRGEEIRPLVPNLRRCAHALTGTGETGDGLVKATLKEIISDRSLAHTGVDLRTSVFRAFHMVLGQADDAMKTHQSMRGTTRTTAMGKIASYLPLTKQIILLRLLEEMPIRQIALILDIRELIVVKFLDNALKDLNALAYGESTGNCSARKEPGNEASRIGLEHREPRSGKM